jgi:hypothetical protein
LIAASAGWFERLRQIVVRERPGFAIHGIAASRAGDET